MIIIYVPSKWLLSLSCLKVLFHAFLTSTLPSPLFFTADKPTKEKKDKGAKDDKKAGKSDKKSKADKPAKADKADKPKKEKAEWVLQT